MRSKLSLLMALAALALALAACGEKEEDTGGGAIEPFDLALDFYVNPDHAGVYTALERGYFEQAGLEVRPRVPSDPSAPIKQVAAGQVDLAISYEPEVLLAREQGLEVTAVASIVDEPLTSLISLPAAGIERPAGLRGKTIATAGIPYQEDYLETILDRAGLGIDEVRVVSVGLGLLPAVLSGRADAMLGGFRNIEGVDLELRGDDPRVVPVDELGVPTYDELVLVAASDRVEDDPEAIRLFVAALARGTQAAIDDPELAAEVVLEAGDGLDPRLTRAEVRATLPLLAARRGRPFGFLDSGRWERFAGWMADRGLISEVPPMEEVLTNELLPDG